MAGLNMRDIRERALEIVAQHPDGIRLGGLVREISTTDPETPEDRIYASVTDLATQFSDRVVKPSRGVFKPVGERAPEELPLVVPRVTEEQFYVPFAEYLKNDLDEVITVTSLGGASLRNKWATPDVVGVYKPLASNLIKFPVEIVSAELKIDPQASVVAFGQAVAYRLFSAKCYIVMPTTISAEDLSRLEALCMLFGVGLVVFDLDLKDPNFLIRARAQKFSPDMFYVNEFARGLHRYNPGLFEKLFGG
jgi:hypothetical protein